MTDLAAIAMHFNPCGYAAPRENFRRFRDHFRGCPLFTAEVSFDGRFHLGCDWKIHATSANLMWQKEQLINWMTERLPASFRKVAWIDADLLFLDPDWAAEASRLLDQVPAVQLFRQVHYADARGGLIRTVPSRAHVLETEGTPRHGACGGAWAARRELLLRHGMYAHGITGGGDTCWIEAVCNVQKSMITQLQNPLFATHYSRWADAIHRDVQGRVACVAGDVVHMYHGTLTNRRYRDRHALMIDGEYDPQRDVRIGWNGLLEWSSEKPVMHQQMADYFLSRAEDDGTQEKPCSPPSSNATSSTLPPPSTFTRQSRGAPTSRSM